MWGVCMQDTKDKAMEKQHDEHLQLAIMRVVAELNQEKFFEYDCETDEATLSVISNGRFAVKETMQDYLNKGDKMISRIAEEDRALYHKEFARCLQKPLSRVFDIRFLNDKGEHLWHRMYLVSVADSSRKVTKIGARLISIHKEKLATDLLRSQAERDSMTGAYNHKTYEDLSKDIIRKNSDGILFLIIDIDNFKLINDTHGHYAGDSIIKQVGEVLQLTVKDYGIAGRIGGDEFSVCLANIWDKETAAAICMRIKDGLKKSQEGIDFSVSIGAARSGGRICSYEELYFEADEALYFVKENGKNQIVFAEELSKKQRDLITVFQQESVLSEEEIALDEMLDYRIIADPTTKKILYANRPLREKMGVSLKDIQKIPCYKLLMGRCKECDVCQLHTSRVRALSKDEAKGLNKYIPDGKFILQSRFVSWKGEPMRMTSIMDMNDGTHVEKCFQQELERQYAIGKCWDVIHNTETQDVDYTKVLRILNEYYDADCCAIISKEGSEYKDVYEYHRNSAEAIIAGIHESVKEGVFPKMEVLIDDEGYMRRRHIEQKLLENLDLIEELEKRFVHNVLGIKLARRDTFVGILLIINPRHHADDYQILKRIGIFFTTDLLRKSLSDHKDYEINHDMLTRLWNRAYFGAWQAKFGPMFKKNYGVFTADIYGLSKINRDLGYENGNERLVEVATLFKKVFGGYSIFRYDADQIMTICHDIDKDSFQKLVNYFREQMSDLSVELSLGYSWTADGDLADVIRIAQDYQEKDKKRLAADNNHDGKQTKKIAEDVESQIANGNFRVFIQPKVNITSEKTVGGEALIRLYEEVRGFVSPAFFIPLLEEKGAIHLVDLFVLEEVFKFQKKAMEEGNKVVPISVNFSKNTLTYEALIERIKTLYDKYPIPAGLIQIEITETISSMDHLVVNNIAKSLRSMGFSVSMDDFGTKYSNMAVLTQFEFDTVKIDRSLLLDVENNLKNKTVLKHTLEMLRDLNIETVMEGVETAKQVEILRELGCETVQGYFYGRPEPMDKFYELYMN